MQVSDNYIPISSLKRERDIDEPFIEVKKANVSETHCISYLDFQTLLQRCRDTLDPFKALAELITPKDGHWTCFVQIGENSYIECQLAYDKWDSTCFGTKRPGEFRYIECFEHNIQTGISEEKSLISIRINEDHSEGEWIWVNNGNNIQGRQSKSIAEDISRAMKIKNCYLVDSAKVISRVSQKSIVIRVPLQVMDGKGYYSPVFSLINTKNLKSAVAIDDTKTCLYFNQDVATHQSELEWLRNLSVEDIYNEILVNRKEDRLAFLKLIKRQNRGIARNKLKNSIVIKKCTWCFKDLVGELYKRQKITKVSLADYEWVYENLLDADKLSVESDIQKRFASIVDRLFFNMLMCADFSK